MDSEHSFSRPRCFLSRLKVTIITFSLSLIYNSARPYSSPLDVWLRSRRAPVADHTEVFKVDLPKLKQEQREPATETSA